MLLEHKGGAVSEVDVCYATPILPDPFPETLIEIDGDKGAMRLEQGYRLRIGTRGGKSEYQELDPGALTALTTARVILDGRNCLDAARWREAGWRYLALGRAVTPASIRELVPA